LRRGLALRRADAAVITNVSADHFGEYGIASVDDIADAKLIVAHAVAHGGSLVLNAADAVLMRATARTPFSAGATQALFASEHGHPALVALRAAGGTTCGVRAGRLCLARGATEHDLGEVAAMPLTLGGAAPYNAGNIAAAVLAAVAVGLPLAAIRATLARFGARPSDNPGRLERWSHRGATVLVDYAHNPDGLAHLLQVARALAPRRLGLLLGQAGNRDDQAIAALAQAAAAAAPDLVVVKELPRMLRGRSPGEVPALIERELRSAGLSSDQVMPLLDEDAAAAALLDWARPGDVIVLPIHTDAVHQRLVAALALASDASGRSGHSSSR
jgi:UDP-N-acetylmuramyl tripeptide synthase